MIKINECIVCGDILSDNQEKSFVMCAKENYTHRYYSYPIGGAEIYLAGEDGIAFVLTENKLKLVTIGKSEVEIPYFDIRELGETKLIDKLKKILMLL